MAKSAKRDSGDIRVSMTGLASFVTTAGRSAESRLEPFKFNKRGEGFARSVYYQLALKTIRVYHSNDNDASIFDQALLEIQTRVDKSTDKRERTRLDHNASAIATYRKVYGRRKFKTLPNKRLQYRIGGIVITAQPDLWVEEQGTQVLLKIGMAKHSPSYIDILLAVLRKAAVSSKYKIRAKNIVYLNVASGREMICSGGLTRFNLTFKQAAKEIREAWPRIANPSSGATGSTEAHP
jgi:hypothetical protein